MSTNYTNHQPYPGQTPVYQPGQQQAAGHPGQPRYPNYRGQAPAQNMPRPYYQPHAQPPQGMPNQGQQQQVAHFNFNQFQNVRIQYHPLQPTEHQLVRPGPPVSNPLSNAAGAPPFQPGAPYPQMMHYPQQPVQMVYQTNGPHQQQHMMQHAGHPTIFTPGQRYHAPAAAHMQPLQTLQHGNMSQAPPAMAHQQQAQSQQPGQQQQPGQMQQPTPTQMYHPTHQQPPRPVQAVPTSAPPPPSSTPSYQPPQQQQQPHQQQQPSQQQQQQQQAPAAQPTPQPTATLRRERKPLLIVDPNTRKAVDVSSTSNTSTSSTAVPTPDPSSTSSTPAPDSSSDSKPTTKVATEFATKVCALASEGSAKKEESPEINDKEPSPVETEPAAPAQPVKVVKEPEVEAVKEKTPETVVEKVASEETVDSSSSSLSVATDMKRDDNLYEPVSPTPLPDSPSDDTNKAVTEPASNNATAVNNKPSPFEEVINKKAAGEQMDKEEEAFEEVKGKRKKPSSAAKKAALNSKGEKKGDLLDVITSIQDPKVDVNDVADKMDKMSIDKPSETEKAGSPTDEAPKVNGVNDSDLANDNNEELEDGEIIDDDDESKQKMTLKYDYPEDQWSPLNPTGKKQYGRDFLIRLQVDPLSLEKPQNLPKMEIVKDSPNLHNKASSGKFDSGKFDFNPSFVKSQSRQGVNKRPSRDGRDRMGKGDGKKPMVISLPSISAEVKLNKAENAWMPKVKDKNKDQDEGEDLRRKVLAILNKLTPSNFSTLVDKFQGLHIDTESKLALCMELVFEKAVDEPSFSVAYAQMCQELQKKKVTDDSGQEVNFRKLLLTRCQQEFLKDYMDGLDKAKYDKEIEEATNPDDKKRIQMEYEAMEMKLRKRSLGNIRFIGELYKLNMLTVRIMHECVRKLLSCDPKDEESLECLCRLLTTVGENLDKDSSQRLEAAKQKKEVLTGIYDLGNYFKDMKRLVSERKTSARVRFLIQDVIELREANWRKRREDAGPKTIDQIHKEAEKEAKNQMIANLTQSMGPPPNRRDDRRDYRQDDRRRSTKAGPQGGGQSDDGWQMAPMKAARQQAERIDTNRISKLQNSKTDADNMSFGPPRGPGASWGRGSQSGKTSRQETPVYTNRFSQLGDGESGPSSYEGRDSGGYPGRYPGRSSRDDGRAGALALVQGLNPRSQSVMGPHPTLSRENSVTGNNRSHSMVHTNNSQHTEITLKGPAELSIDEVESLTKPLIDEFLNIRNFDEALKEVADKFSNNTVTLFLSSVFNQVIELSEKARSGAGSLISHLCLKKMVSQSQLLESLTHEEGLITVAEDMIVDIPKFWDFLAQILAPVVSSGGVDMGFLMSSANGLSPSMRESCCAGKYVAAILSEMGRSDKARVGQLWRDSCLLWSDFLPEDKVNKFLADNKLEWTQQESSSGSSDNVSSQLTSMLKFNTDVNEIISWIDNRCSDKLKTSGFIRALTTVILESCIEGYGGPNSECKIIDSKLRERNRIIKKYVGDDVKLQGEALVAVQFLIHRLEHPNKMLHSIFETFYHEDVIVEEAFIQWEQNTDPEAQDGKGVALKSCNQFLVYIKEAEPEDEDQD